LKYKLIIILSLLCALISQTGAQPFLSYEKDSVRVPAGSVLYYADKEVIVLSDTIVLLNRDQKYTIAPYQNENGTEFFDSLKSRALQSDWTNRLHNIIIRTPKNTSIEDTVGTRRSADVFIPYHDKIIRNIRIAQLTPFGPSIRDTSRTTSTGLEDIANDIHIITDDKVISNHLLFKTGDRIDPWLLSDNERIIRKLSFIVDARLYINQPDPLSDSVDILVLVKDAFSYGMGGEIKDINAGKIELFNNSIQGFGHEFHSVFHWDIEQDPWLGYEFIYKINNISGSFINPKVQYLQVFDTESFKLELDRIFFSPNTRYAGAFSFERTETVDQIEISDTLTEETPVKYNRYDSWIGRSFYLSSREKLLKNRTNLILSGRFYSDYYFTRPVVTDSILYDYHNKNILLFSVALSQQSFFKSNLIYSFGRTEDIPQGMLINFTAGPELSDFNTRWYAGLDISRGGYLGNAGYMFGNIGYGGYLEDIDFVEQGVFHARMDYFTNLFIVNRFKFRHFINLDYVRGIRRLEDELININDRHGIRGYNDDMQEGTHKLTLRYESVAFSPYYFYGFRFVFFGFADLGLIGTDAESIFQNRVHSGFGLGLRVRNERLVFETIQIRIGYYPTLTDMDFPFVMDVSGEKRLRPSNFFVTKPKIIGFD